MPDIRVNTPNPYVVHVGRGFAQFAALDTYLEGRKVAVVTDANVDALYGDCLTPYLSGLEVHKLVIPAGEAHKSAATYLQLLNALAEAHFTRKDAVVALGGGVVGDLAGFVASTYMRGIALIAVPTSLLAMVDSSVGGKTAINLERGKNLCGTFYQPRAVFVNTDFLATLPPREEMCGWGEIVKYAFLCDTIGLADLEGAATPDLIAKCVQVKADVVSADEREGGLRKLLNLGHTVGHAIERLSGFALSHGECVVKGLKATLDMSRTYLGLTPMQYDAALALISAKGHDLSNPYCADEIMAQILSDKKSDADGTDMVLIDGKQKAQIVHLPYDEIRKLLA